jgi:hypothetical protein
VRNVQALLRLECCVPRPDIEGSNAKGDAACPSASKACLFALAHCDMVPGDETS